MDPSLRDAVLGSANIQAPVSPLGSFPELAQLHQSSFQLPQSSGAAGVLANQAQQQVSAQKSKSQTSNFKQVKKSDGGFAFYDADGKEISASDYAYAIGKKPVDVLKDSENPIDIGYQQDYKNLQDYMSAKLNSKQDPQASEQAKQIEEQVRQTHGIDLSILNPQQLIDEFKKAYPTVYGRSNTGVPVGQVLVGPKQQVDLTGGGAGIGQ